MTIDSIIHIHLLQISFKLYEVKIIHNNKQYVICIYDTSTYVTNCDSQSID